MNYNISGANMDPRKGTFDTRIISYEDVHQITSEQKEALVRAVDLKESNTVLDACCGYGSVTKWLGEESSAEFYLLDESPVQIERAKANIIFDAKFDIGDIMNLPYADESFDKVVLKMGLHENPKDVQQHIVNELHRVLKPGGKLVIWELYLSPETQSVFQSFIRAKDALAGFTKLVENRYFPTAKEIENYIQMAGFINFKEELLFQPELHTKARLKELVSKETQEKHLVAPDEELLELASHKLQQLNDVLRGLPDEEKSVVGMEDKKDDIVIKNIRKAIVSAKKG